MTPALVLYVGLGVLIVVWGVTGGADLGGGVLDLVVRGPHRDADRQTLAHRIAPIWEANHVWLIFIIVVLFSAFPPAFSTSLIAFHVPVLGALVGIVIRGTAFTFRSYGLGDANERRRFGFLFGLSSMMPPFFFGLALAGAASGDVRVPTPGVVSSSWSAWLSPFSVLVGVFAVTLLTLLAASHVAADVVDTETKTRFSRRAIRAQVMAFALAMMVLLAARDGAPLLFATLSENGFALALHVVTGACALASVVAFLRGMSRIGRAFVVAQFALIVGGFGASMNGALILPDVTVENAAAPASALWPVLIVSALGMVGLIPALKSLYVVFRDD